MPEKTFNNNILSILLAVLIALLLIIGGYLPTIITVVFLVSFAYIIVTF